MSELDTMLAELRDELNAAIPLPDVEHVTGRARARRKLQLGAIAAVVAVAVAVPVLRAMQPGTPVGNPPVGPKTTYVLDFADPDHGYAIRRQCDRGSAGCSFDFLRTSDGGRHWQRTTLPKPPDSNTGYFNATLYALGQDEASIDVPDSTGMPRRIHTTNGGRTWQTLERWWVPNKTIPLGPTSLMGSLCGNMVTISVCGGPSTMQPDTGMAAGPPSMPKMGSLMQSGPYMTEDGKWWVLALDDTTKRWSISVSADGGRSWAASDLGVDDSPTVNSWAVVERNGVMYATASAYDGLLGVWRTLDDGRSWTRTWTPDGDQRIPGLIGTPIAASDGSLVLSDGITTFVSTDQGATFRPTGDRVSGTVRWTRAGYLRSDGMLYTLASSGTRFALSTDGLHWRDFTVH